MTATVTHTKVATIPDGADPDEVLSSDWNGPHVVTITAADVGAEAAGAVATHEADTTAIHGITNTANLETTSGSQAKVDTHAAAGDPHTGYRLESATIGTTDLAANAVTLAKMATQADQSFLGNVSGSTAVPSALTIAQILTALRTQVGVATAYVVTGDVTHAQSNTTLSSVTGLTFSIGTAATEIWMVELYLMLAAGSGTPDVKWGWAAVPSAATIKWAAQSGAALATQATTISNTTPPSATVGYSFLAFVFGGGNSGAVQFQFAQDTSSATDITVNKGSVMRVTKLVA